MGSAYQRYPSVVFCMRAIGIGIILILIATPAIGSEEKRPVMRVGILSSIPPRCFLMNANGERGLRGMDIDLLNQIERVAKVRFEYVQCESVTQRRQWFEQKRIDVEALSDVPSGELPGARFIPVGFSSRMRLYVHESCKTVVCSRDLTDKRVAVVSGTRFEPHVSEVKGKNLVTVESPIHGLQLLNAGKVDVFLAESQLVADYVIQKENLEHVVRVGMVLGEFPLALTVHGDDPDLLSRLQRAMALLHKSGTIRLIEDKWYGVTYPPPVWKRWYIQALVFGILAAFLILFVVAFWNYQLKRRVRKITADLQSSDLRYRAFVESSPDMIFVTDGHGQIRHANLKARSLLSHARSVEDLTDVVVRTDRQRFSDYLTRVIDEGSCSEEFHFMGTQGQVLEVDVAAARIPPERTQVPLVCCFARDVTEANRIKRELVNADRMSIIGQMAAGVAHEINNPIGIVRTNIELILSQGWFSESAREFLESSRRNTIRAGKIIKDLLAVAKPRNPEMANVDLRNLVQTTLAIIGAQLKHVDIQLVFPDACPTIWGDRNQIQQVLVNVFLNATDAMKGIEAPKMKITCCVPEGSDSMRLRVEDTGPGLDKDKLYQIFEPFFTHGKQDGFGLGLFISRLIMERHNGIIFAESDPGKGAQITIELPLSENGRQQTSLGSDPV